MGHWPTRSTCLLALALCQPLGADEAACQEALSADQDGACRPLEQVTIFGTAADATDTAGGANHISAEDLENFVLTDVARALRQVPGVALQLEDGYGLRPNISIRGTATERSSRVTLLEDNVLIAPAPYSAPAAYYFPTFGRIDAVEVLKGPAAITQGPYTVGGAVNLLSTPMPADRAGLLQVEGGSDATWRLHGWYGDSGEQAAFLVETHQWRSDGFQHIDRSDTDTGLDKQDYLAKLQWRSRPGADLEQRLDIKLQSSSETSQQSYLGLTDEDFAADALRRYGASALDEMDNEHTQVSVSWGVVLDSGLSLDLTAYDNGFERAWYKTEALDISGSAEPAAFSGTGWANVIDAINRGQALGGSSPEALQAILDGADTATGAIQVRNNSREYWSRGVQATLGYDFDSGATSHRLQAGLRLHRDQEDRLQRNDNYSQRGGTLVLDAAGLQGNAGNRILEAEAWAAFIQDRIEWDRWTLAPGLRFESIDLTRVDYRTSGDTPWSRDPSAMTGRRDNRVDVWIPGLGVLYALADTTGLVGGVHKGFATPGASPGVDPEESVNYEFGIRHQGTDWLVEALGFFSDYENLVGVCTNSSGSDCEPGDAFNGEGVHIPGLELTLEASPSLASGWRFPLRLTATWMDAEFQTDFVSEFYGTVSAGDPVPYVPDQQWWLSLGAERDDFSLFLNTSRTDGVCTQASCDAFQRTGALTVMDLSAHYRVNANWQVYGLVENLADEEQAVSREPYGARPNRPRAVSVGLRYGF